MWLVPPGPPFLELAPGVYRLPPWLDARHRLRLAELVAALCREPVEILALPLRALGVAPLAQLKRDGAGVLLLPQAELNEAQDETARGLGTSWIVLIPSNPERHQGHGWVERQIKPVLLERLRRWQSSAQSPLHAAGLPGVDLDLAAAWFADPLDLLDLLAETLDHRLGYAPEGLEAPRWASSLRVGAGRVVGARITALHAELQGEAVAVALGLVSPESPSSGGRALAGVGLASADGSPGAWVEALAELDGLAAWEEAIPASAWEDRSRAELRRRRVMNGPLEASTSLSLGGGFSSSPGHMAAALTRELGEVPDELRGGLDTLARLEKEPWRAVALRRAEAAQAQAGLAGLLAHPRGEIARGARLLRAALRLAVPDPGDPMVEALAELDAAAGEGAPELRALGRLRAADGALAHGELDLDLVDGWFAEVEVLLQSCSQVSVSFLRAELAYQRAIQARIRGDLARALSLLQDQALPGYREAGADFGQFVALNSIGALYRLCGDLDEAERVFRDALNLAELMGEESLAAYAKVPIADLMVLRGALDEALNLLYAQVIPVLERQGTDTLLAAAWHVVVSVSQDRGELEDALQILDQRILPIRERVGGVWGVAVARTEVAQVLAELGRREEAIRLLREEVIPALASIGDVRELTVARHLIAKLLRARGDIERAMSMLQLEVLPAFERLGDVRALAVAKGEIAFVLEFRGEFDAAIRLRRDEELPIYQRLGLARDLVVGQANLAQLYLQRGGRDNRNEARRLLKVARRKAEQMGLPEAERIRATQRAQRWDSGG